MNIINSNKKFPPIIIVAIVSLLILFGFALWQENSSQGIVTNPGSETTLQYPKATNTEEIIGEPIKELMEEENSEALVRDKTRLADVEIMKQSLEDYKNDIGNYPEIIDEIIPKYLTEIPAGPNNTNDEYNYTCIGSTPCRFYDLTYELEVGVGDITPGIHVASPDEIASP